MNQTIDYEEWLCSNEPEGYAETEALYLAVNDVSDQEIYRCEQSGNSFRVYGPNQQQVLVLTKNELEKFVGHIDYLFDIGGDIESRSGYHRNMENPKA